MPSKYLYQKLKNQPSLPVKILGLKLLAVLTILFLATQSGTLGALIGTESLIPNSNPQAGEVLGANQKGYTPRFKTTTRGAMTFTGNSLGLNTFTQIPGSPVNGSIQAFSSLDQTKQISGFPAGTTTNWQENGSTANLNLPDPNLVLYAELIWGGSYKRQNNVPNITDQLDTPVRFTTPKGTSSVSPDAQTSGITDYGYVRTANVTDLVREAGAGTYSLQGVPALIVPDDASSSHAGWSLAVVYANDQLPIRNMSLFTGSESVFYNNADGATVRVSGFGTPLQGEFGAKIYVVAQEGDSDLQGDQLMFGLQENDLRPVSGPNNQINNFFAGQINNDNGSIAGSGTFGDLNHPVGSSVGGKRHGIDITAVDVSDKLQNGISQAYIKGTSTGDIYVITGLGFQIDVNAPNPKVSIQRDKESVRLGDQITYTITVNNDGVINGLNAQLKSLIPQGTELVANSFTVDGQSSDLNPINPIPIGNIAPGENKVFTYTVKVNQLPPSNIFENEAGVTYEYIPVAGAQPVSEETFSSKVITFGLSPIGLPPEAQDDTATGNPNTPIPLDLTTNDTDPDDDLDLGSLSITRQPANGSLNLDQTSGKVTYTPNPDYIGDDNFEYQICDAEKQCDTATANLTIKQSTPLTAQDDTASTKESRPITIPILNNDDPGVNAEFDLQTLVITPDQQPSQGRVSFDSTDGQAVYTPNPGFVGQDRFNYTICNQTGACDQAEVVINVTALSGPKAQDDTASTQSGKPIKLNILSNDTPGDSPLSPSSLKVLDPTSGGTLNIDPAGTITYTPKADFSGNDRFTYEICDQNNKCDSADVNLSVSVPALPIAKPDSASTTKGDSVVISVLNNDQNPIGGIKPEDLKQIVRQPASGTLNIDPAGTITYTPNPDFVGADDFSYQICNSDGCSQATVSLDVKQPGKPDAVDDQVRTQPQTSVKIPVLENDTPGSERSFKPESLEILNQPESGQVSIDLQTQEIIYTPKNGFFGNDDFSYQICNDKGECDTANVSVEIPTPQKPNAQDDIASTQTDTQVTVPILSNDDYPQNEVDPKNITFLLDPIHGTAKLNPDGSLVYTPKPGFVGEDRLVYKICTSQNQCDTAEVKFTVNPTSQDGNPQNTRRPGQVLGVRDTAKPLPRTGGLGDGWGDLLSLLGLVLAAGFFGSLYFNKHHSYKK